MNKFSRRQTDTYFLIFLRKLDFMQMVLYISKNMLQPAKARYLESYLWEAAVDWRQVAVIGLRLF